MHLITREKRIRQLATAQWRLKVLRPNADFASITNRSIGPIASERTRSEGCQESCGQHTFFANELAPRDVDGVAVRVVCATG